MEACRSSGPKRWQRRGKKNPMEFITYPKMWSRALSEQLLCQDIIKHNVNCKPVDTCKEHLQSKARVKNKKKNAVKGTKMSYKQMNLEKNRFYLALYMQPEWKVKIKDQKKRGNKFLGVKRSKNGQSSTSETHLLTYKEALGVLSWAQPGYFPFCSSCCSELS